MNKIKSFLTATLLHTGRVLPGTLCNAVFYKRITSPIFRYDRQQLLHIPRPSPIALLGLLCRQKELSGYVPMIHVRDVEVFEIVTTETKLKKMCLFL